MQDSLVLDVDDACHILTVETGGPIFSVAVQSGVLLDLEECPVAVLSRTPPDPANGSLTLATYRCSPAPAHPPLPFPFNQTQSHFQPRPSLSTRLSPWLSI